MEITCVNCGNTTDTFRDEYTPENAISMGCNYCPKCDGGVEDYYEEWYNFDGDHEEFK